MESRIRERLQDLATDAPSGSVAPPILLQRARHRAARTLAAGALALGLLALGLVAGVRTFANSSTQPASEPSGPTRTPGLGVSDTVSVSATQGFTDTGITISQGEVLSLAATGRVAYSSGHSVGPQGVGFKKPECSQAQSGSTFAGPGLPCWSLIGRIGARGQVFYVGPSLHIVSPAAGELFLGYNDNAYGGNSGAFSASISQAAANASFEQPVLAAGTSSTECGTSIPDWVIAGCVNLNTGGADSGTQWIDLNANEASRRGSMTQILPLSTGTYSLHFAFAGNTSDACGGQGIKTMTLLIDGQQIGAWSVDTTGSGPNPAWVQEQKDFTVSGAGQPTSIEFHSTTHENCAGPAIDSVRLVKLG